MARYNSQSQVVSYSGATTIGTPLQGSTLVEFTGTSYTVTLYSPAAFPGTMQAFYNAASGTVTLSAGAGNFVVPNVSSATTYVMQPASTVSIYSDGTNFIVENVSNGPTTSTTFSASSTTTLSPANANVTISPSGTGTVTMAPATAGTLNNLSIGQSTAQAGTFTALTATGTATVQQIVEVMPTKSGATGVVVHDFSTGDIFYHTSIAANFTVNLTNTPTTANRSITLTLILVQGGTAFIPNAIQINGSSVGISWAGGVTPTGRANKIDVATFVITNPAGSFTYVLGQYGSFG